jgi:arylsulfatase B
MKLNRFLFALFLSFFILKPVSYARDRVSEMPNLIILLADDLGYGELGCQGNDEIPTPHIDGIAKKGVRFTQGYVTAPNCSPIPGRADNRKIRHPVRT